MFRSIVLLSFCLGLGLFSCGRLEYEGKPACLTQEDCAQGYVCREGFCTLSLQESKQCASFQELCAETCIDTQSDASHCGACGHACPEGESCRQGACTLELQPKTCTPQEQLCAEACVDTQSDAAHCGECGHVCPPEATCQSGQCVCPTGQSFCGGLCMFPWNYWRNKDNCGVCGNVCEQECAFSFSRGFFCR